MIDQPSITLNGKTIRFEGGETLLSIARREGVSIPTLCHDPRLDPAGACRTCLVEIEGWGRLAPACAVKATPGMVVTSENDRIQRHRRNLLALYLTDHPKDRATETGAPDQLLDMADQCGAPTDWLEMKPVRSGRPADRNPYIVFQEEKCIACARCTRYCDEVEGVAAITLAGRGSKTTISTADGMSLLDSTCELCGGCVDTCPTGAMTEKMPLTQRARPEKELEKVRTTCNYCGVGCQFDLNVDREGNEGKGRVVKVTNPPPGTTTNDGNLCVKGRFAYDFIDHPDRLTVPLIKDGDGFREASWEEALACAAKGLTAIKEKHGPQALGFISSSRCTGEENYLVQKLARVCFSINNVHQCAAT